MNREARMPRIWSVVERGEVRRTWETEAPKQLGLHCVRNRWALKILRKNSDRVPFWTISLFVMSDLYLFTFSVLRVSTPRILTMPSMLQYWIS